MFKITREWLQAGCAIFTVHNDKGTHYTFKIAKKDGERPIWFVSLLAGPDNLSDYQYMGVFLTAQGLVKLTAKSAFMADDLPVRVFNWAVQVLYHDKQIPDGYGINHAGRCGRCGRTLTRPEGVDPAGFRYGFGPECFKMLQVA